MSAISSGRPDLTHDPSPDELLDQLSVPTRLGERPGLERIRRLLAALDNPHRHLRILHVGGTSGKGSTATMAARIFEEAGYRVGLHVKPHLETVEERLVVGSIPITPSQLVALIREVEPIAREVRPSWYELTVALALTYFARERVDLAVVEVGLGGTYDATNIVEAPVAILTNVGLDHTEVLGDTVEKIAADKVGIAKPGATFLSGATQASVVAIVTERCAKVGARLCQLGRDFSYTIRRLEPTGSRFDLWLPGGEMADLSVAPLGAHQVANATLAVVGALSLASAGLVADEGAIRRALATVQVPGRLEIARSEPLLALDGAHNPAKMTALAEALATLYPGRRRIGVLAFKRGHDVAATLRAIAPLLDRVVITQFEATTDYGRGQALPAGEVDALYAALSRATPRLVEADPIRAVQRALRDARPTDLVVVTGSLYLVGAIRAWLRSR